MFTCMKRFGFWPHSGKNSVLTNLFTWRVHIPLISKFTCSLHIYVHDMHTSYAIYGYQGVLLLQKAKRSMFFSCVCNTAAIFKLEISLTVPSLAKLKRPFLEMPGIGSKICKDVRANPPRIALKHQTWNGYKGTRSDF